VVDIDEAGASAVDPVVSLLDVEPLDHSVGGVRVRVPLQERVGKLGFPTCAGSIGLDLGADGVYVQTFAVDRAADYPDRGSRAELWMQHPTLEPIEQAGDFHPDAYLVELECLSPLVALAPGESVSLDVTWSVGARRSGAIIN
jgi:hypothetical protein